MHVEEKLYSSKTNRLFALVYNRLGRGAGWGNVKTSVDEGELWPIVFFHDIHVKICLWSEALLGRRQSNSWLRRTTDRKMVCSSQFIIINNLGELYYMKLSLQGNKCNTEHVIWYLNCLTLQSDGGWGLARFWGKILFWDSMKTL